VALLSAAALAYEVLLVRAFAIQHFQHFAHMAIGVAMLGFGASGTLLALRRRSEPPGARRAALAALAAPWTLLAGPAVAQRLALDPTQLLWDGGQWLRLGTVYLTLAMPLAVTSLAILIALAREPARAGRLYGASFIGSGVGAAGSVAVLWLMPPERALAVPAVLAALGGITALGGIAGAGVFAKRGASVAAGLWTLATLAVAGVATARPPWRLEVSPYKGLPQVEAFPEARRVFERSSPLGWTVAVTAPSFRHAPGLSLAYRGRFPRQTGLFVDGETVGATTDRADGGATALVEWMPSALPYALGGRERVLVLADAGDLEVRTALAHGARSIVSVGADPHLVEWSRTAVPDEAVTWIVDDPRSFVARSPRGFDLVTLGLRGGLGGSAAGVHALREDFGHTVEAYVRYLRCLSEDGVLAASCWISTPPRESTRLALTAAEAVRRVRPGDISRTIVVSRSWGTVTVLVKPSGFDGIGLHALRDWARAREFEVAWPPDREPALPGDAPALDERALLAAIRAAVAGSDSMTTFAEAYPFSVAPAVDARPYPQHFLRAASAAKLGRGDLGRWLPFAEWGYVALMATAVQSVLLAAALLLVPVALRHGVRRRSAAVAGYFAAIGLGYMAAEIAAIPPLSLALGHPVYAVAAVLTMLLVFSGLGSVWSDRLAPARGSRVSLMLAAALAAASACMLPLAHAFESTSLPVRAAVALAALAPLGFLMGMPFPLGVRSLAPDARDIAWAWASNGFASVVAAPVAALVAIERGTNVLMLGAAAAYAAAAIVLSTQHGAERGTRSP
jgi:hypothetical protein